MLKRIFTIIFISCVWMQAASAQVPRTIDYQGVLTDGAGEPVSDGTYSITTAIYDTAEGGVPLWQETRPVNVFKSTFSMILGSVTAIELPFDEQYYLGISIEGGEELAPRVQMSALPYSIRSAYSESLEGFQADAFADSAHNHDDIYCQRDELSSSGSINGPDNPVDWSMLKNVPSGFSDGVDDAGLTSVYSLDAVDGSPVQAVYVDEIGNTGIGTTDPVSKLDVRDGIAVTNTLGQIRNRIFVHDEDAGIINTYGPNGNLNCALSAMAGFEDSGYISVCDENGSKKAAVYVEGASGMGVITADIKNFRVANPSRPGTDICYACIEGPEAAAYIRGTADLKGGRAVVEFPDHFSQVIVSEGMTVQLTPLSAGSKGLAVIEKGMGRIVIVELGGGIGEYRFDYLVTAVRKGHQSYQVIRESLAR